jgi:multidrug efflux system membrane fusion protein
MRVFYIVFLILSASCHKKQEAPKKHGFPIEVVKPTVKNITLYKSYVGNIQPFIQVEVKAQVEGELLSYYFTEGQQVKKGDLLFKIDERPYKAQLLKAEGALEQSLANLSYSKDVAKRNKELAKDEFVSQQQYDQYLTDVLRYEGQVKQNEADIQTAKINISYCNIHSPIDAVTGRLQIQVGNLIKNAGSTPLITLNQITPIYVYFSVPQKDLSMIMKLHRQKSLKIHSFLESDNKTPYIGDLDMIDNQVNDQTGSIWLRGVFSNEEQMLWPGEFVDVQLLLEPVDNAILVPSEAVSIGQKGKYVFIVKEDNIAEIRYIETGQRFDKMTFVKKGLKPSDLIVTKGQINLGNGTPVTIKKGARSS